jgi:hypothetical protein
MSKSLYVMVALLSVLAVLVAGCSTTGPERAQQAASSMDAMRAEIQKTGDLLNGAVATLTDMVEKPKPDLKEQYQAYTGSITALDAQLALVRSRADEVRQRGLAYFDTWKAQSQDISNPEMKQHAQDREAKLREKFESIRTEMGKLGEAAQPLLTSLRDVQTLLSLDLTPQGVQSVAGPAKKAQENLATVKTEAAKVREDIDAVRKLLAPSSSPAPAPAPEPAPAPAAK